MILDPRKLIQSVFIHAGRLCEGMGVDDAMDAAIPLRVKTIDFIDDNVPAQLNGFRILHLTDPHLTGSQLLAQRAAFPLTGLHVDLTVLTGDYMKGLYAKHNPALIADQIEFILSGVRSNFGFWGCVGNHDTEQLVEQMERRGIRFLRDESVDLLVTNVDQQEVSSEQSNNSQDQEQDDHAAKLRLVGIDYQTSKQDRLGENPAFASTSDSYSLILTHSPVAAIAMAKSGHNGYLCGHTHGTQVSFFKPLCTDEAVRGRARGKWRIHQMQGYTSPGIGTSNYPWRIQSTAEVTIITLRGKKPGKIKSASPTSGRFAPLG